MFGENKVYRIRDFENNDKLLTRSIFYTVQGEGPLSGLPAIFIRTARCSLKCDFCDTDFDNDTQELSIIEILDQVKSLAPDHCKLVVITGGEPLLQPKIGELINELIAHHFGVQVETSGSVCVDTLPLGDPNLMIICSPKTGKLDQTLEPYIDEYKYVIEHDKIDETDGLPLKLARPIDSCIPIWVSPCDKYNEEENKLNLEAVKQSSLKFGHRISLQIHKYLNVE